MYLFELWLSPDICPVVGLQDHMTAGSIFSFLRNLHTVLHSGCSLSKEARDLYAKNCKTLMKKIKDDTNRQTDIPCSWIERMFLMAPRLVILSRGFQFPLPRSIRGITIYGSYSLTKYISSVLALESQNDSLIQGLQSGCFVSRHENINLLVHL